MKIGIACTLAFLAASIEATLWSLPLTLLLVVYFGITNRSNWIFFFALIAGMLVDSLTFRPLGVSSFFFLLTLGAIFLYGRKFETDPILFGILFTTLASIVYVVVFGSVQPLWTIGSMALVSSGVFLLRSLLLRVGFRHSLLAHDGV